jgi:chemotaxis protein MotB
VRRRLEPLAAGHIWPAFTDVLGSLLILLIFLLTVFVISEVLLTREMASRNTAIGQMASITEYLEGLLGESASRTGALEGQVAELRGAVAERESALAAVRAELASAAATRKTLEASLEARAGVLQLVEQERERLRGQLAEREQAYAGLESDKAAADARLAGLEAEAALLSTRAERLGAELERLNAALYGTREELSATHARVRDLEGTLAERDTALAGQGDLIARQQTRLEEMDRLIKRRLLDRVEELEAYASEFFGRLRGVFADNPDIKVVGDRFVFQSEVLFPSGEATLSASGRTGLDKFVTVYRQVAGSLPPDLPVVIEVQGHTDRVPISTAQFASNWELSAARAIGVVNYLISRGIPPERLAAKAMGQHQPIDGGEGPDAYRRNRRIEIRITSR